MQCFRERLQEKAEDWSARPVIYVAFGDSVTHGFREHDPAGSPLYPEAVYHRKFQKQVQREFPGTVLSVINAGVALETATDGLKRLERDVISLAPDLVTISFGLNDAMAGPEGLAQYTVSLQTIAERIQTETAADLIFITPNLILTDLNPNIHEKQLEFVAPMLEKSRAGIVDLYAGAMREVAAEMKLPLIDVHAVWKRWEREGREINLLLANGTNHPGEEGHQLIADLLFARLVEASPL